MAQTRNDFDGIDIGSYDEKMKQIDTKISECETNISNLQYHSPWTRRHFVVQKSGLECTFTLSVPIDCGIVIVSMRCAEESAGGSFILNVGYFPSIINQTGHNEYTGFEVSGNADSYFTFHTSQIGSISNGHVYVSVLYPYFNYRA